MMVIYVILVAEQSQILIQRSLRKDTCYFQCLKLVYLVPIVLCRDFWPNMCFSFALCVVDWRRHLAGLETSVCLFVCVTLTVSMNDSINDVNVHVNVVSGQRNNVAPNCIMWTNSLSIK